MRVFFSNLGCKLNQAELEGLARQFHAAGHTVVPALDQADLHVVNTCTVTHQAARDSRKLARRGQRVDARIRTVLTGCYVAEDADRAAALAGVDLVVGNHEKNELLARVEARFGAGSPPRTAGEVPIPYVPLAFGNARALVKVEDGCNMRCSFCIIPATRGRQRSLPMDDVVDEVRGLTEAGFGEIVITGVQISAYRDRGAGLFDLVSELLARTSVRRLRLTSIAPWQFDERILSLFSTDRLCRHFHLSLQSGCEETLARMRRPYRVDEFGALVGTIREAVPGVAVTTDVIVGFPGETDEEFEASLRAVERLRFARVHAFPYSERHGTEAADLPDGVPPPVRKERMRRMLEIAEEASEAFARHHSGRLAEVLWEESRGGVWHGTTDNYLPVTTDSDRELQGVLERVRLGPARRGRLTVARSGSSGPLRMLAAGSLA